MEKNRYTAYLVNNRIVIFDVEKGRELYRHGFYGKFVGIRKAQTLDIQRPLELTLFEALYLQQKGILKIYDINGVELDENDIWKVGRENYENFDLVFKVYSDLRERGYVVKSGMKFGATFAVYEHGPGIDHAPFLVHVLPYRGELDPIEIVRAGRLSHSVRKKFVIATVNPETKKVLY
ncbi:MAG: tRNA-intron lyase, partial [Thermoprotei archaeon]